MSICYPMVIPFEADTSGLTVIGSNDLGFASLEYPFMNFMKGLISLQAGSGYGYPAILDADNYPTSTPTETYFGVINVPTIYTGRWVIKWTGTARINISPAQTPNIGITVHSGGAFVLGSTSFVMTVDGTDPRVEFSFNGVCHQTTFSFLNAGTLSGMADLVLCRLADEAAVDAIASPEDVLNPDFISLMRTLNARIFRPMGWTTANASNFSNFDYERPWQTALTYGSNWWVPNAWVGTIGGTDTYTCGAATDTPVSWTDGEMFQGQFTNANTVTTPTINVNGRGAKTIVSLFAAALAVGEIAAASLKTFTYDAVLDQVIMHTNGMDTGIPLEVQVAVANSIESEYWLTTPAMATDASITAMVEYVRDNLTPGRNFYIEHSNEIWNFGAGFPQTAWTVAHGAVLGFDAGNNRRIHGPYAKRVCEIANLATAAWSPRSTDELNVVIAVQAFGSASQYDLYRFLGTDLAAWGFNTAPNRPIDKCSVLSYAHYYSGAQLCNFDATYNNVMTDLLDAADDFNSGDPTLMQSALDFVDSDIRAGTRNSILGSQTLLGLNTNIYPAWQTYVALYGKPLVCYEGGMECAAPSTSRLTALGLDPAYSAKISALLESYKLNTRFYALVRDQFDQLRAVTEDAAPAWLILTGPNQWAALTGNIYSTRYQSWNAMVDFN